MADETLQSLFLHTLKDVYFAENQILKNLPKMAEAAGNKAVKEAFEKHRQETEGQVKRLEQVFASLGQKPEGVKCHAIEGLAEEAKEVMEEFSGDGRDAGLIAAAQAVEHYEISRYGTLRAWARQLGNKEAFDLLSETLVEEENTDDLLSQLGEDVVNPKAA